MTISFISWLRKSIWYWQYQFFANAAKNTFECMLIFRFFVKAYKTRFKRYSEYSECSLFFFHCGMIDASKYRISLKTFYLSTASCIAVGKLPHSCECVKQIWKSQLKSTDNCSNGKIKMCIYLFANSSTNYLLDEIFISLNSLTPTELCLLANVAWEDLMY